MNLSGALQELIAAGVCSFKIEGRLKDKAYVMNVVAHYRQQLDALIASDGGNHSRGDYRAASSGKVSLDFSPNPEKTFNRGYSEYFFRGRRPGITSWNTPKSLGEILGRVAALHGSSDPSSAQSFTLDSAAVLIGNQSGDAQRQVVPGDGICFFNADGELCGSAVTRCEGDRIYLDKREFIAGGLEPGTLVYRNHDHAFLAALEKSKAHRRIGVHFTFGEHPAGYWLRAADQDGNQAEVQIASPHTPADKPGAARANLEKQLGKLGNTIFHIAGLDLELPSGIPFLPLATLNAMRRAVIEKLEATRQENFPRPTGRVVRNSVPYPETSLSFRGNALNRKAVDFYHRHGVVQIEPAAESGLDLHGRAVMVTRYCIKYELGGCPKTDRPETLPEPLVLFDEQGQRFPLRFDCKACVMLVYLADAT